MTSSFSINNESPVWKLSNGYAFPIVSFATTIKTEKVEQAVKDAIDVGYRHFEIPTQYNNEKEVLFFRLNSINKLFHKCILFLF